MSTWKDALRRTRIFLQGAASVYLVAALLGRVGSVLLVPLYARKLSLVEYGDYALAQTIVVAAAPVVCLGLPAAITRFYFEGSDRNTAAIRSGSVAHTLTVFAALVGVLGVVLVHTIVGPAPGGLVSRRALDDIVIAACGGALAPIPFQYFRAQQKPFAATAIQVFDLIGLTAFGVYFVAIKKAGLLGALDAMGATGAATSVVSVVYVWARTKGTLSWSVFKEAVRFSYPILIQFYAQWFLTAADRWTLKLTRHDAELGSYALAFQVANPTGLPASAWNESEYARLGEISRMGGLAAVRRELPAARRMFLWLALLPTLGLAAVLPALPLLLGPRAHVPLPLVLALAASLVVDAQLYPSQTALFYASRTQLLNWHTAVSIVVNASALACFVPRYGALGAAVARLLTSVGRVVFLAALARRSFKDA